MPENLTPPQGLNAVVDRKTIYGLPMGLPTGGGGTQVIASLPPTYQQAGGMRIQLVGDYTPAVRPPVQEFVSHTKVQPGGMCVSVESPDAEIVPYSGMRVVVVPESSIVKIQNASVLDVNET